MSAEREAIQARLSTFDTAMVLFSLVVGIGIFRTPAIVAAAAGSTALFYGAWILAGAVSLIGAFLFAEIGARYPRAGGYYRVVADCYHPRVAFMLNWSQTVMQGAGAAGVALIGADYLLPLVLGRVAPPPRASLGLACALMLALLLLNYVGIRPGARAQNVLSGLKILLVLALALAALWWLPAARPQATAAGAAWPPRLASALVPCFYAYGGYQMTMNLGADLRHASRRFPLAIGAGMAGVIALYLLINYAYQHTLGTAQVAQSALVAATLARRVFGAAGAIVVSVAVFLSAAGFVNATILQMPRSFYAMAQDGVLPRAFLRVNPDTQVQEVGLLFFGLTMLLPALLLGSFDQLLNYVILVDTLSLAVVASTLFVLRRRQTGPIAFRVWGYPVLPGVYMLVLLAVAARVFYLKPVLGLAGVLILATGWPLYHLGRRLFGQQTRIPRAGR